MMSSLYTKADGHGSQSWHGHHSCNILAVSAFQYCSGAQPTRIIRGYKSNWASIMWLPSLQSHASVLESEVGHAGARMRVCLDTGQRGNNNSPEDSPDQQHLEQAGHVNDAA